MTNTRWWQWVRLASLLSLTLVLGMGCEGGKGTSGGVPLEGTTRLALHVTTPNEGQSRASQPTPLAQTRATGRTTSVRVVVSGVGIPTPIVVSCSLTGPATPECQLTSTPTTLSLRIELIVPRGTKRLVVITAFDENGALTLSGEQLVDLLQPTQTLSIVLNPQTGTIGTTLSLLADTDDVMVVALPVDLVVLAQPEGSQVLVFDPTSSQPTLVLDRPGTYLLHVFVSATQVAESDLSLALSPVALQPGHRTDALPEDGVLIT